MHRKRIRMHLLVARIDIDVKRAAGREMIEQFDAADFDDAIVRLSRPVVSVSKMISRIHGNLRFAIRLLQSAMISATCVSGRIDPCPVSMM
jgi:hypothetical protein